jgi:hypothetical protein
MDGGADMLQPPARSAVKGVPATQWCDMPIAAWCLLLGLYLLLAGQTSTDEMVAAALASAAATLLLVIERRVSTRRFAFRGIPWLRILGDTASALLIDTLRVARGLLLQPAPSGTIVREPFHSHGRDDAARGLSAVLGLSRSIAPNAYIIEVLLPRLELLQHRLSDTRK